METVTFSLPDKLRRYVQQRVGSGGYGNTSEYIRDLIRRDQEQQARARLEAALLQGLSEPPAQVDEAYLTGLAQRMSKRVEAVRERKRDRA